MAVSISQWGEIFLVSFQEKILTSICNPLHPCKASKTQGTKNCCSILKSYFGPLLKPLLYFLCYKISCLIFGAIFRAISGAFSSDFLFNLLSHFRVNEGADTY